MLNKTMMTQGKTTVMLAVHACELLGDTKTYMVSVPFLATVKVNKGNSLMRLGIITSAHSHAWLWQMNWQEQAYYSYGVVRNHLVWDMDHLNLDIPGFRSTIFEYIQLLE